MQTSRRVIGRAVSKSLVVLGLTIALVGPGRTIAASNGIWIDSNGGGLWSSGGNWLGGTIADGVDAIADFTTLDISTDDTVHLDSTRTIGQLLVGDTTPSNSWILDNNGNSANALKLFTSVGTPSITVNSGTTATISAALIGNQGFTKSGNGTLALSGPNAYSGGTTISGGILAGTTVSLQGNILDNATLVFDQSLTNLVSGTYSGQISGTGAVTKNGVGTVTLSGTSSYSGATTISNGNLVLGGNVTSGVNGPLGNSAGAILLGDANTPAMANPTLILGGFTISRPITIQNFNAGGDTYFVANVSGGSSLVSGLITLNQPLTIQQAGPGGGISLIGGINGNGNAITFTASGSSSNSINVNSPITGVGTSVTANSIGTVTLNSGANTYSGSTTVSAGTLELASPTALPGGIGASGGISGLTLAGGVIGLANGDFSRGLGTGASQVQWTGSGGFAAVSGPRNVNLGGLSATVTWNSGGFVPTNSSLVLSNGAADSTVTFQNPINLAGATQIVQVDRGAAAIDTVLSGVLSNGGLTKTGAGILSLAAANNYSGGTTISAGTLLVAANAPSGSAGPLGNASSAVLLGDANTTANNSSPSLLIGGAFNVGLPITVQNQATAGVYTIGGNTANSSTFSGLITLNQPATLNQVPGGTLSITGGISANSNIVTLSGGGIFNIDASAITGNLNTVVINDPGGIVNMGLNNGYFGSTTVTAGTLRLSVGGGGAPGTNPLTLQGTLDLNGFSTYVGRLSDGGSSTGVITNSVIGTSTFTVQSTGGATSYSGTIQNGGPGKIVNLALSGVANETLSGANTYGMAGVVGTTVSGFTTLKVNNTSDSGTGAGDVAVSSNGTIGGTGTIAGTVSLASGAILAPGNSVGTLTVGGLTLAGGSILNYEFNTNPTNDRTVVTINNGLAINGGGFNLYAEGTTNAWSTPGTYTLFGYSGTVQGAGVPAMSILNPQANRNYMLTDNTSQHAIQLTINTASAWTGASSATWANSGNWSNGIPGATSGTTNTDAVIFNSNPGNPAPIVDPNRNIQSITFDTASVGQLTLGATNGNPLLLTSGGTIRVTSSVTQAETVNAPLVIEGTNGTSTFTSASQILNFGGGITGGAAGVTVLTLDGATLQSALGGVVANGAASLLAVVKNGSGTWILNGTNTFSGGVTFNAGILVLGNDSALGTGALTVNGGQINNLSSGHRTLANAVHLFGNLAVFNADVNDVVLAGTVNGFGGLNKFGNGLLVLSGSSANTFTGPVNINDGGLSLSKGPGIQATSGTLSIGDGSGAADSAIVSDEFTNQFPPLGANVTMRSDGLLAFDSSSDSIASLSMTGGTVRAFNSSAYYVLAGDVTTLASSNTAVLTGDPGSVAKIYVSLSEQVRTFNVAQGTTSSGIDLDVSIVVADAAFTGPIVKAGLGTMRLSGANTFSGGVHLNSGTLLVGNNAALGTGTLTANGGTLQADNNGPYTLANALNLNTTLTVAGSADLALSGPISGAGGITKIGSSTLTLSGNDTFSSTVAVNVGTLAQSGGSLAANVVNQASFVYNSGTFNGRLTNVGITTFNADFTAGNGIENDGSLSIPSGRTITLNGSGLDNEGFLSLSGGVLNLSGSANVNRGTFNLSAVVPFNLKGATLTNGGALSLNGGTVAGAGVLSNGPGGVIAGPGTITSLFTNAGGLLAITATNVNVLQPFSNSGDIQLISGQSGTGSLGGGAIANTNMIQGAGSLGNSVINNGTIQALGGTLFVNGALSNSSSGLLTAGTSAQLLVTGGLNTNSGIINLTGGTFDNGGHSLNNAGQISGWGIFRTGGTGLDNNGSITFSGGVTTVNGPVTNESGQTITVAQNPAVFTGMVTNNGGGTFNTISATATFAGGFANNGNSNFATVGNGSIDVPVAAAFASGSSMSVGGSSKLNFDAVSGAAAVGTGVTATVASGATLELAGSVSALSSGSNRVNVQNNSSAPGVLVSGTNQQVGNIDGNGTTQVNAGSDLTANHIIQTALAIGGTAGSPGLVTIDASDASGNPLVQTSGFALADSLTSSSPFDEGVIGSAGLSTATTGSADLATPMIGNSVGSNNPAPVPEPPTLLLALLAVLGVVSTQCIRHHQRYQTV